MVRTEIRQPKDLITQYGLLIHIAARGLLWRSGITLDQIYESAPDSLNGIDDPTFYHGFGLIVKEILAKKGSTIELEESIPPQEDTQYVALTHHSKKPPFRFPIIDIAAPLAYLYTEHGIATNSVAKNSLFKYAPLGRLIAANGGTPVSRVSSNRAIFDTAVKLSKNLAGGRWELIAPEGGSTPGHYIGELKRMALLPPIIADVKILPVATATEAVALNKRFDFDLLPKVAVKFGASVSHGWEERENYSTGELLSLLERGDPRVLPKNLKDHAGDLAHEQRRNMQKLFDETLEMVVR